MNINSLCSSPTGILLGIINGFHIFSLLVLLATNARWELVVRCSQNLD